MEVREVMTTPALTLEAEDTLSCAARLMRDRGVGCLPIVEPGGRLVGILTDRDIALGAYVIGEALWRLRIGDHMSASVVTCRPLDSLADVLGKMRAHHVRRLPVLDEQDRPIGLVSLDDLVYASRQPILEPEPGLTAEELDETYQAVSGRSRHPRAEVHK